MNKNQSLLLATAFQDLLIKQGIPVRQTFLYGSVAVGRATDESDIDVAVVCAPFGATRMDENFALWKARRAIDLRIEPVCLHPEDFENRFFSLAQEVKRTGVPVQEP